MPTKPRITFQARILKIRISHLRAMPNYTKQTQFTDPRPKNAKQTQSQPSRILPRWPKVSPESSGNPISSRHAGRRSVPMHIGEPNSRIPSVPPPPVSAKRTQFHPGPRPKTRNEPNLPHRHHHHEPGNAKRTQFRPPTAKSCFCETNPISACAGRNTKGLMLSK